MSDGDYDNHYKTEDLFGAPYPELINFFKRYEPKGRFLDLGCGQGRDSIPVARLGYQVTGIDISKLGIEQIIKKSESEKLNFTGMVGDIYTFNDFKSFDIVLLDSMFHFEKKDLKKETGLIINVANQLKKTGLICVCIHDKGKNINILKETLLGTGLNFETLNDTPLNYTFEDKESGQNSAFKYGMLIVKKK